MQLTMAHRRPRKGKSHIGIGEERHFFIPAWLGKGGGRVLVKFFRLRRPKNAIHHHFQGATCILRGTTAWETPH